MDFFNYDFKDCNVELVCRVPSGCGERIHHHRPSHGIAFHTDGIKEYVFNTGKKLYVKSNDIIFLPQYSDYIVNPEQPGACYAINFTVNEPINFEPFILKMKNTKKIIDIFSHAEKNFISKNVGYMYKCRAQLYSLIYEIIHEYSSSYLPSKKERLLKPAVDYIHAFYTTEEMSIDFLASLCGIKESYLRRLFTQAYGLSPIQYINKLRLNHAKDLLSQTSYKVTDISALSGFNNQYWFCRFFKKETGLTPTEYRNNSFDNQ